MATEKETIKTTDLSYFCGWRNGKCFKMEQIIEQLNSFVEYAYLCKECYNMTETVCWKDGKCPECGCEAKTMLYIKRKEAQK